MRPSLPRALWLVSFAGLVLASSSPAQILQPFDDSLTTYKASATAVQGVQPQVGQRGVGLDGSARARALLPVSFAGNPFENAWTGHEHQGDLQLDTGSWSPTEVDIALPATGFSWIVGRSFSSVQKNSGGSLVDSDAYQGKNWFQTSQPEIVFFNGATDDKDQIYLVYGADRYVEFKRVVAGSAPDNQFIAVNGAAGAFDHQSGSPDLWVYTDPTGMQLTFLGFNTSGNTYDGLLWKIADPAGNVAFVGDSSSVSTAISNGWDGSGRILKAYDTSDRRYTYAYTGTSYGGKTRLASVIVEQKSSGTWASPSGVGEVYRVEYEYYASGDSHGDGGDLKLVRITEPLSDLSPSPVQLVRRKHYRYWEGSSDNTSNYNASTNPGYVHALKYIYDFEGSRRADWDNGADIDEDFLASSDNDLAPYAAAYFEYDTAHKVSKAWFHGQCGCSGAGAGTHEYTYETNGSYSNGSGYTQTWARRTIVKRPDNTYLTQVFDELGQGLTRIQSDIDPATGSPTPKVWVTHVSRDATGCVDFIYTPANITAYTHSTGAVTSDDCAPRRNA